MIRLLAEIGQGGQCAFVAAVQDTPNIATWIGNVPRFELLLKESGPPDWARRFGICGKGADSMEYLGINIIQHAALATDEVWVIHKNDAPQIPAELRGCLSVPCILTGDASRARQLLSFMRAIDSQYVTSGVSRFVERLHA